jgi:2-phospho-L-lactate/phosphoenolpyruvate guanylyltransferase
MALWAIVPVKPLRRNKSRLAGVLSEDERTELNHRLLIHTIEALKTVPQIENILVISKDDGALSVARDHGARTVLEQSKSKLNVTLARATIVARSYSLRGVLILPADLPLLNREDINFLLQKAEDPPVVVIVPDRHRQGTNALLVSPAGIIDYEFGPGSFLRHCEHAREVGARLEICELPSLSLDIDLPEDLKRIEEELESLDL